jgi:hypothetical protein
MADFTIIGIVSDQRTIIRQTDSARDAFAFMKVGHPFDKIIVEDKRGIELNDGELNRLARAESENIPRP